MLYLLIVVFLGVCKWGVPESPSWPFIIIIAIRNTSCSFLSKHQRKYYEVSEMFKTKCFFPLLFDDKFIKYFVVQKVVQMSLLWLMANQNHMFSAAFCWHLTLFVEIKLNSLSKKEGGGKVGGLRRGFTRRGRFAIIIIKACIETHPHQIGMYLLSATCLRNTRSLAYHEDF